MPKSGVYQRALTCVMKEVVGNGVGQGQRLGLVGEHRAGQGAHYVSGGEAALMPSGGSGRSACG